MTPTTPTPPTPRTVSESWAAGEIAKRDAHIDALKAELDDLRQSFTMNGPPQDEGDEPPAPAEAEEAAEPTKGRAYCQNCGGECAFLATDHLVVDPDGKSDSHYECRRNPYLVTIDGVTFDLYRLAAALPPMSHAQFHAFKKIAFAGKRGHKDRLCDLREARAAVDRAIELCE